MQQPNPFTEFGVVDPKVATSVSGVQFLKKMLNKEHPAPPFGQTTQIWPREFEAGRVIFEAEPSGRFYNPMGTVHGGWIATLLDSAMACAVHSMLKQDQAYTTVEMKVNFVRPVFESTGGLRCEAAIIHFGGRVATSEGRVLDRSGNLIAHGTETCLVMNLPGK